MKKFYTDLAKLVYLLGAIDVLISVCTDENATVELKSVGATLQKIKGNVEE